MSFKCSLCSWILEKFMADEYNEVIKQLLIYTNVTINSRYWFVIKNAVNSKCID